MTTKEAIKLTGLDEGHLINLALAYAAQRMTDVINFDEVQKDQVTLTMFRDLRRAFHALYEDRMREGAKNV